MEAQLIRCLKNLINEILVSDTTKPEEIIANFLEKSELTISPSGEEELIKHLQCCIAMLDMPK